MWIVFGMLPFFTFYMFRWIGDLVILVLFLIGIIKAINGKQEELPVIGKFAEKFTF